VSISVVFFLSNTPLTEIFAELNDTVLISGGLLDEGLGVLSIFSDDL